MLLPERNPKNLIEGIDKKINKIIQDIQSEVTNIYEDEDNDPLTAYYLSQETWIKKVYIPNTREEATKILEDKEKSRLDKLGASLFVELWKKLQLQRGFGIKNDPDKTVIIGQNFDSD